MIDPLTITVPAREVRKGDYMVGHGVVLGLVDLKDALMIVCGPDWKFYNGDEPCAVHLEDYGNE